MGGGLSTAAASARHGAYRYGSPGSEHEPEHASGAAACAWVGKSLDLPSKPVSIEANFQIHGVLGTGMLGCVRLVQFKKSKKFYALKSMKKDEIMAQAMLTHAENERAAFQRLTKLQHPFLVKFFGSIQTSNHVHLVLEYAPGGELLHRLHQVGGKFTHDEAKFYATELVEFVCFCHAQGFMYRDLKPENVLLDAGGHIKVVDLGFVRQFTDKNERCSTSVGTPQYLAPEQLTQSKEKRSYTCAVDWWALACMIYEMVVGKTPFAAAAGGSSKNDSPFEVYTRIVKGKIQWPHHMVRTPLKDLLCKMLTPDLTKRLSDGDAIKQHAWFADVDWHDVHHADVAPPFTPQLRIDGDRSCFDEYPDEQAAQAGGFTGKANGSFASEFRNF